MREISLGDPSNKMEKKLRKKYKMILSIFMIALAPKVTFLKRMKLDFIKYDFCLELFKESVDGFDIF